MYTLQLIAVSKDPGPLPKRGLVFVCDASIALIIDKDDAYIIRVDASAIKSCLGYCKGCYR